MNALESKRREGRRRGGGGERSQSQHREGQGQDRQQEEQEEQQQIQNQQQQMQGLHGFDDQKDSRGGMSLREMEKRHLSLKKKRLKKQRKLRRKELEEEARRTMRRVGRGVEVMGMRSRREQRMDNGQF